MSDESPKMTDGSVKMTYSPPKMSQAPVKMTNKSPKMTHSQVKMSDKSSIFDRTSVIGGRTIPRFTWSGRRDSNPRPRAWEAGRTLVIVW